MSPITPPRTIAQYDINQTTKSTNAKRIEYVDALRGFTMFLVVVGHVFWFSLQSGDSAIAIFLATFRMPLFFFISGFVGYKSVANFEFSDWKSAIWKKFTMAMIPCIIFFILCSFWFGSDSDWPIEAGKGAFDSGFYRSGMPFGGYWFVPALFKMFTLYYTVLLLCSKFKKITYASYIVMAISLLYIATGVILKIMKLPIIPFYYHDSFILYMSIGLVVRQHFQSFKKYLNNERINALFILLWIALFVLDEIVDFPHIIVRLCGIFGIFVFFSFFYHCRNYFAAGGTISRCMQFVGKRTLDIYLMHYLFIPTIPYAVISYLKENEIRNILLILVLAMIVSALVISICLAISTLIRKNSNLLAHYLLGAKREKKIIA